MKMRSLLLLSLSLALIVSPLAFANNEDLPPRPAAPPTAIALEKTTDRFGAGDWVYILDADKEEHPVIIQSFKDGKMLVATPDGSTKSDDGQDMLFSPEAIKARVGWWARQWYTATRTRTGNWILAGAGAVAAAVAVPAVSDVSLASNKGTDQVNSSDLVTVEQNALANGPSDGAAYNIEGTFTGGFAGSGSGLYQLSITFGPNFGGRGGYIKAIAMPPKSDGTPQVLEDAGRWSTVAQSTISFDLPKPYAGRAKILSFGAGTGTLQFEDGRTTFMGGSVYKVEDR